MLGWCLYLPLHSVITPGGSENLISFMQGKHPYLLYYLSSGLPTHIIKSCLISNYVSGFVENMKKSLQRSWNSTIGPKQIADFSERDCSACYSGTELGRGSFSLIVQTVFCILSFPIKSHWWHNPQAFQDWGGFAIGSHCPGLDSVILTSSFSCTLQPTSTSHNEAQEDNFLGIILQHTPLGTGQHWWWWGAIICIHFPVPSDCRIQRHHQTLQPRWLRGAQKRAATPSAGLTASLGCSLRKPREAQRQRKKSFHHDRVKPVSHFVKTDDDSYPCPPVNPLTQTWSEDYWPLGKKLLCLRMLLWYQKWSRFIRRKKLQSKSVGTKGGVRKTIKT